MIIAFCGHSNYVGSIVDEKTILDFLEKRCAHATVDFFLGEYGGFDHFAYNCCKKYKDIHPNSKLIFVTPYFSENHQTNHLNHIKQHFDSVIFPPIENVPPKYAITHRNKWIANQADVVIAYITHTYGGAYSMYLHAKRKSKEIFNIAK